MADGVRWRSIFDAARHNDENAVRYFIEKKGVPPTYTNGKEQTVAHIAALNGNIPILEYVLNRDPSLLKALDENKNNPFFLVIEQGFLDAVKFLVDFLGVDILEANIFRFGNNAVHIAAQAGRLHILRYFLEEKHIDVNVKNELLETPVFYAAEEQHLDVVKYLVEDHNANVTTVDWNDDNILYTSAKVGDLSVPKYLLDERQTVYDINGRDKSGDTIAIRASRYGNLEFLKYFVEQKGADVDIADKFNRTPLYHAASQGHLNIVRYLVENGADLDIGDLLEKTPQKIACTDDVVKYLKNASTAKKELLKRKLKEEKELKKEALQEEKELKKKSLKEEKELKKKALKEENELKKKELKEEKALKQAALREEKELKKKAVREEKALNRTALREEAKRRKKAMKEEKELLKKKLKEEQQLQKTARRRPSSYNDRTSNNSTKNFTTEPSKSLMGSTVGLPENGTEETMINAFEETTTNFSDTITISSSRESIMISSMELVEASSQMSIINSSEHQTKRRRRNTAELSTNYYNSLAVPRTIHPLLLPLAISNFSFPKLSVVRFDNFLSVIDVCFRYFGIINYSQNEQINAFTLETSMQMDPLAIESIHSLPVPVGTQ